MKHISISCQFEDANRRQNLLAINVNILRMNKNVNTRIPFHLILTTNSNFAKFEYLDTFFRTIFFRMTYVKNSRNIFDIQVSKNFMEIFCDKIFKPILILTFTLWQNTLFLLKKANFPESRLRFKHSHIWLKLP